MKRERAIRYAREVARRVHAINGLLATPLCLFEAVRIRRIWVFGSTAKGSESPNDLDLLIDLDPCGRRITWRQGRMDKEYYRRYGIKVPQSSEVDALKWLTKGMRQVSRHTTKSEQIEIDVKLEIYPRWMLD